MSEFAPDPIVVRGLSRFTRAVSVLAALVGLTVLIGWLLDAGPLKTLLPGLASMKANTALCFVLLGVSVLLMIYAEDGFARPELRRGAVLNAARLLAVVAGVIALATFAEYLFGWNMGLDELLFQDVHPDGHSIPGRMAPHTAICFLLLASAAIVIPVETKRGRRPAQWLSLGPAVISLSAMLGYLYSVVSFYRILSFTGMAVHTASTMFLLSLAVFFATPDRGLASVVTSNGLGGILLRRLLPAVLIVPIVLGWLRLEGQKAGLYGTEFGLALMVTASVIVFSVVVFLSGLRIQAIAIERHQTGQALQRSREGHLELHYTLESVIDACPLPVIALSGDNTIQIWNGAAQRILGWAGVQVYGRPCPFVPDERRGEFQEFLERVKVGDPVSAIETTALTTGGTRVPVVLWAAPIIGRNRGFSGFVLILDEVTRRKQTEARLQPAGAKGSPVAS